LDALMVLSLAVTFGVSEEPMMCFNH
jgi:hypothetical protein